jgi:Glycosyltransferase
MTTLLIANGNFFSTFGGGQIYVKNVVDEMIRQQLDIVVFSFVYKKRERIINKREYKGIPLFEIYQKDKVQIVELIKNIKPALIHAHAQKVFFAEICKELNIPYIVTAHHGGITCPAGALMNAKDEICKIPVSHKDCLACVLKNTKEGLGFYRLFKYVPLAYRLRWGKFIQKIPFVYFLTPWCISSLQIENKRRDWETIINYTDMMIAPSQAIAGNMILNGFSKEKIRIIPHGIATIPCDSPSVRTDSCLKFFYVGRISYIKGIHKLLQAFIQLDSSKCQLHLVGDLSEKYAKKLQTKYHNYSNIIFHGKINPEQVLEYICNFDVLVHSSICLEIFGLNIAEALSQNKPVIATRCGGAEMQIQDKKNGLLVEPNNTEAIRKAMQYFIDHPNEIKRMSLNAPTNIISIEEHVKQLVTTYNNRTHEK